MAVSTELCIARRNLRAAAYKVHRSISQKSASGGLGSFCDRRRSNRSRSNLKVADRPLWKDAFYGKLRDVTSTFRLRLRGISMGCALHKNAVLWRGHPLQEGSHECFISRVTQPPRLVLAMKQRTLARAPWPGFRTPKRSPPATGLRTRCCISSRHCDFCTNPLSRELPWLRWW